MKLYCAAPDQKCKSGREPGGKPANPIRKELYTYKVDAGSFLLQPLTQKSQKLFELFLNPFFQWGADLRVDPSFCTLRSRPWSWHRSLAVGSGCPSCMLLFMFRTFFSVVVVVSGVKGRETSNSGRARRSYQTKLVIHHMLQNLVLYTNDACYCPGPGEVRHDGHNGLDPSLNVYGRALR